MVLDKQDSYGNLVRAAYPNLLKNIAEKTVIQDVDRLKENLHQEVEKNLSSRHEIIVDGDKRLQCLLCPECNPTYPEKIIAKS